MVSFAFETGGAYDVAEAEPAVDLMDMINGGVHTVAPDTVPFAAPGPMPVFGSLDGEDIESDRLEETEDESQEEDSETEETDEEDEEENAEFVRSLFTNCALMRQRIEEELKEVKQTEKNLLKKLQRLMNRDYETEVEGDKKPTAKETESQPMLPFEPTERTDKVVDDPDWWMTSAATVLADVPRLGENKRDALLAICSDLKDLEDLRGEASRKFKHFSEVLPDGIGKALADAIEEAMFRAMK